MAEAGTEQAKAYAYAIYLLSLHLRTSGELREKLRLKKYNAQTAENVIGQLLESRYLDDGRFAEIYLDNLKKYKNFGYYGIKKKLMEKRLDKGLIERVLEQGLGEAEELKIARRLLQKDVRMDTGRPGGAELGGADRAKQKLAAKLKSRGFRGPVIAKLLF